MMIVVSLGLKMNSLWMVHNVELCVTSGVQKTSGLGEKNCPRLDWDRLVGETLAYCSCLCHCGVGRLGREIFGIVVKS